MVQTATASQTAVDGVGDTCGVGVLSYESLVLRTRGFGVAKETRCTCPSTRLVIYELSAGRQGTKSRVRARSVSDAQGAMEAGSRGC